MLDSKVWMIIVGTKPDTTAVKRESADLIFCVVPIEDQKMQYESSYPGQFDIAPDTLHVAIPRVEIVAEMAFRGEEAALNDVCMAVTVIADALDTARTDIASPG